MTIRELRADDDLGVLLELCKEFFAEYEDHHEEFFDTDNLSDDDISGRFIASIDSETSATLVAVTDDSIVGYMLLSIREQPRFYKVKRVGAISALMVAKEYRRRGIGTRLLVEAGAHFLQAGVKYFTFYTSVANEVAANLYKQCGMEALQIVFLGRTKGD